MVTLEIDGVGKVQVDKGFLKLSKQEKQNFVEEISLRQKRKKEGVTIGRSIGDEVSGGLRTAGQGLTFGWGDELEAGARTGFGLLGDYDKTVKDVRGDIGGFREANPVSALALEVGGGLLTGGLGAVRGASSAIGRRILASKAGNTGFGLTVGAGEGALAGVGAGEGSLGNHIESGLGGALMGGVVGGALPSLINVGGKALNRGAYAVGLKSDDAVQKGADLKTLQSFERAKLTPDDVQTSLDNAVIPDTMIADVAGESTRRLGRASANVNSEGAEFASKQLDERQLGLGDQISDDVSNVLGSNKSATEALEEIVERQRLNANDDYDKAFNLDGKPVTVSKDKIKPFLNLPAFDEAFEQASVLARLDGFNMPKTIDEFDKIGNFSLKELHYIKMGVDEVMGLAKRGNSRTSIGNTASSKLKKKQKEFVQLIDDASPKINGESSYSIARGKFAGEARMMEALEDGEKIYSFKPEEIDRMIAKMGDSEKESFRIGVAEALRKKVETTADMADAGKKIFGNKRLRDQLKATFPKNKNGDSPTFEVFAKRMMERTNQVRTRTNTGANMGSRTTPLAEDIADMGTDAVTSVATRGMIPTALNIGQRLLDGSSVPSKIGAKLAPDLFSIKPDVQRAFLNRIKNLSNSEKQRMINSSKILAGATGGLSTNLGLLTGDNR